MTRTWVHSLFVVFTEDRPMSGVPEIYQPATVRVVTPSDGESIGIGF